MAATVQSAEELYEGGRLGRSSYTAAVLQLKSAVRRIQSSNGTLPVGRRTTIGQLRRCGKELKRALALGYDIAEANTALAVALGQRI
jgi:hypothetical protein